MAAVHMMAMNCASLAHCEGVPSGDGGTWPCQNLGINGDVGNKISVR
jgi:hypothetical protein